MVQIIQKLVPASLADDVTYSGTNPCNYIVIHETANEAVGADAERHAKLQANGNSRAASWHYTVDEHGVYQSFKDTARCWHGGSKKYNLESIGIEICVNKDGNYTKAVGNAIELVKILMARHNISTAKVINHRESSGWKDCPHHLRSGDWGPTWTTFKNGLNGPPAVPTVTVKPAPAVKVPTTSETGGSKYVRAAQLFVNGSGYPAKAKFSPITVDGYNGPKTQDALLRVLQYLGGTDVDGKWGPKTRAAVKLVKKGTPTASWVCLVQAGLNAKGTSLAVDGVFGSGTESALKGFQKSHGLGVDGICGALTFEKLIG